MGVVVRFNMAAAVSYTESPEFLDLTAQSNSNAANWVKFVAGFQDGTYGYLVTYNTGLVIRFSLASYGDVEEISLTNSNPLIGGLKVGDTGHFFFESGMYWEQMALINNATSTDQFRATTPWTSYDAVFAGESIYVLGTTGSYSTVIALCQDWRNRQETLRSCSQEVSQYGLTSSLESYTSTGSQFTDDVHVYMLPGGGTEVVRIGLAPNAANNLQVSFMTIPTSGSATLYFNGGFHDGNYGYWVPGSGSTMVLRFDLETFSSGTYMDLSIFPSGSDFQDGFASDGYGYLLPRMYGVIFRFLTSDFTNTSLVEQLDLTLTNSRLRSFSGGVHDGTYGYLAPYQDDMSSNLELLVRFKLDFTEVMTLDLSLADTELRGFTGIFTDGTYGYLYPGVNYKVGRFTLSTMLSADVVSLTVAMSYYMTGIAGSSYGYLVPSPSSSSQVSRMDLATFALGTDAVVDSGVSSWYFAEGSNYDIFFRSSANYSRIYKFCEVASSASSSCDGQ
ncbi:unnamed protein product, partial [Durusdinium trenchii]